MQTVTYAPDAFRALNGFFCVYKPAGLYIKWVKKAIQTKLVNDLNMMEVRPPKDLVVLEGSVASGQPMSVKVTKNLADVPAVVGPRYQEQDISLRHANFLGRRSSGVMLFAIQNACGKVKRFREKSHIQVMEVKGKFGYATDTCWEDGKVREKATYRHIHQEPLERTLASIQASDQAEAYMNLGIHIGSQEAYELASKGLVRPVETTQPLLYSICCTEFSLPSFTLKIHCVNATDEYLSNLVHQIGLYLRSCAVCCQVRQVQYGHFLLDHALLRKHWTVEHILGNTVLCKNILGSSLLPEMSPHFKPIDTSQVTQAVVDMQEQAKLDLMDESVMDRN